jgi:hypothetical protein
MAHSANLLVTKNFLEFIIMLQFIEICKTLLINFEKLKKFDENCNFLGVIHK